MDKQVYTLGIVGCGKVAAKHARAVRESRGRLRLAALVDSSLERAEAFAGEQAGSQSQRPSIHQSLSDLIANQKPDIIAITTPSGSHYAIAKEALTADCDVLIEKPMTLRLDQARELRQLAEEKGRLIVMGHIYRYFPLVGDLKADLAAGLYGRILSGTVTVRWGHDQTYYDSAAWRGTWSADGGVLMNQTIHALDLMCWLMNAPIREAQGQIRRFRHKMESEDFASATCTLENGAFLLVEGTTNSPESNQMASFYILCEEAEIEAGLKSGKPYLKVVRHDGKKRQGQYIRRALKTAAKAGRHGFLLMMHPHTAIYQDFVACLDEPGRKPLADAEAGVSSVEHILAIYRSAKQNGQKQMLPLPDFSLDEMRDVLD